jgi:hypothetical protein
MGPTLTRLNVKFGPMGSYINRKSDNKYPAVKVFLN